MKTITPSQEQRVRDLIAQGHLPGRVAELAGVSLAAVDRLCGTAPEPDRTAYGQAFEVKHSPRAARADERPTALRRQEPTVTPPPPPRHEGSLPDLPALSIPDLPATTRDLICLVDQHPWTWRVIRGRVPTTCPEHRGLKAFACKSCEDVFFQRHHKRQAVAYCSSCRTNSPAAGGQLPDSKGQDAEHIASVHNISTRTTQQEEPAGGYTEPLPAWEREVLYDKLAEARETPPHVSLAALRDLLETALADLHGWMLIPDGDSFTPAQIEQYAAIKTVVRVGYFVYDCIPRGAS